MANSLVENGIKVNVEVSLNHEQICEQMAVKILPDAVTLLPQVKTLIQRVQARARAMMLREMAGKFMEISVSGVFPKYEYQTIQAHAVFSMPGGIVANLNSPTVEFVPTEIAEACIFEQDDIEDAQTTLLMQLLAGFAALGGAYHERRR